MSHQVWVCTSCGDAYATIPDKNANPDYPGYWPKSGLCFCCPPRSPFQSPHMTSFNPQETAFDISNLTQQLLGEILLYERLNNVIIPSV